MSPSARRGVKICATPTTLDGHAAYLSPSQVAELLQVSEKTIYRWAKADPTIPMLKIGGTVRFPRERLERWLRSREQGQPTRGRVLSVAKSASDQESRHE